MKKLITITAFLVIAVNSFGQVKRPLSNPNYINWAVPVLSAVTLDSNLTIGDGDDYLILNGDSINNVLEFDTIAFDTTSLFATIYYVNSSIAASVGKIMTRASLDTYAEASAIADDGTVTFTASKPGSGKIMIDSSGVVLVTMYVHWDSDGTTYIDVSDGKAYITTATTDSDGAVCLYDGGTAAVLKNRLGYITRASINIDQPH